MFSFQRFQHLLRWSWAHSPRWYLFAHAGIFILFLIFNKLTGFGPGEGRQFINGVSLLNILIILHVLSLGVIACDFLSRHFTTARAATDYYSLPVSFAERTTVFLLVVWVILPIYGFVSSMLVISVLKLFSSLFVLPPLAIAAQSIFSSILVYWLVSIPLLAWAILRPKHSFWSALGMAAGFSSIVGLMQAAELTDAQGYRYQVPEAITQTVAASDVYGPSLQQMNSWQMGHMMHWVGHPLPWVLGIALVLLFLASAALALKNRQV